MTPEYFNQQVFFDESRDLVPYSHPGLDRKMIVGPFNKVVWQSVALYKNKFNSHHFIDKLGYNYEFKSNPALIPNFSCCSIYNYLPS